MVNSVLPALLEGLFPHQCLFCGLPSRGALPLCAGCKGDLQANKLCCSRCALPLPGSPARSAAPLCGQCLRQAPAFDRVIAPWLYDEMFAYLIHRWKYQGEQRLTALLAQLWLCHDLPLGNIDLMVPVPLHWRRRWWRGFNQSQLLCRALRDACPELAMLPILDRAISRKRATAAQSGMNARQRARNLKGAFTVHKPCDNLRVAVVDDVLTTGATAAALARELRSAGASHIEIWCLARTPAPTN